MKREGISHVVVVVKDIEKAVKLYSELFGISFQDVSGVEPEHGVRAMVSWEGGIEICSPINTKADIARELATFLEKRGEGVIAVAFNVKDIEEAATMAVKKGIRITRRNDVGKDKVEGFKWVREVHLDPADTHGVYIALFQKEPI